MKHKHTTCHLCGAQLTPHTDEDGDVITGSHSIDNDEYGHSTSDWYVQIWECPSKQHRVTLWFEDNPPTDYGQGIQADHWSYEQWDDPYEWIASFDYHTNEKLYEESEGQE